MAHEFTKIGDCYANLSHVDHVHFDGAAGTAKVYYIGGAVETVAGEDADAVAKAVGRHDAKHATAKEAHAEEAKVKAAAAAEAKAAEPEPPAKGHK